MIDPSLGMLGGLCIVVIGSTISILTAVLAKLSGDEVSGWLPVWSHQLLESAVALMPPEYQDRYREEWKGELAAFRERKLSGLRFAWRLRRRARSVTAVLAEDQEFGLIFKPEQVPPSRQPLDPDAIAEIVRRVVERSQPVNQLHFKEIVKEMEEILGDINDEEVAHVLTQTLVGDIANMRRAARVWPSLPAMRPQAPLPPLRQSRRRLDELRVDAQEADYGADWGFLSAEYEEFEIWDRNEYAYSRPRGIKENLKSWLRGEIWL